MSTGSAARALPDRYQRSAAMHGIPEPNRGCVVRKLKALLPAIHDARIRDDLPTVLVFHEKNMERVGLRLSATQLETPRAAG
ncbi:hypothetical protein [Cupriavidus pinatubonensis]|uniref:hypothetical protein n=1 Tax=Cupriavidus pinatubonensis TaxID=248026 RepID=UPI003609B001